MALPYNFSSDFYALNNNLERKERELMELIDREFSPEMFSRNVVELSSNESTVSYENNVHAFGLPPPKTNYKKYPMRSDKMFSVVPNLLQLSDNMSNEEISLRSLNIGPDHYYKSEMHKISDKFNSCNVYVTDLIKERQILELVLNINKGEIPFNPNYVHYYRPIEFKNQFINLIIRLENEYPYLEAVLKRLDLLSNKTVDGHRSIAILKDYCDQLTDFKEMAALKLFQLTGYDLNNVLKDEADQLKETVNEMSSMVRNIHVYFWSMKFFIFKENPNIAWQLKGRNIFIGS